MRCAVLLWFGVLLGAQSPPAGDPAEVYVRSYDGTYIAAAVRRPPGDGPLPAMLFIHGGVGGSGLEAMKKFTLGRVPEHFFRRGYVVVSTDYRRYHFGEDEIQDVLAAYRQIESYPFVDKSRIGVVGGSHGGYLAKMLATRVAPAAVVSFAGLSDIEELFFAPAQVFRGQFKGWEDWRKKLLAPRESTTAPQARPGADARPSERPLPAPGTAPYEVSMDLAWRFGDRRELYHGIAPKQNAAKISSPLLYLVGSRDDLRFAGKDLIDVLKARGVKAEYSEHAGMPHGFYWGGAADPPQQFFDALKVTEAFLERRLRKAAK